MAHQDLNLHYKDNEKKFGGTDVSQHNRRLYRSRFTTSAIWLDILNKVTNWFGSRGFRGIMRPYQIQDRVVR
jgi:hypothetical protein